MSVDRSSTAIGDGVATPDDGGREPPSLEGADQTLSSPAPVASSPTVAGTGTELSVASRPEASADDGPVAVQRMPPWAAERVLAAAVRNQERTPTFRDLLRHAAALTKQLGQAEQAIGQLTVERDALRRWLDEPPPADPAPVPVRRRLDERQATEAGPVPRVETNAVVPVAEQMEEVDRAPSIPEPMEEADPVPSIAVPVNHPAAVGSGDNAARRRWTVAALLIGAVALLLIAWWALDPSFGLPRNGGPVEVTPPT